MADIDESRISPEVEAFLRHARAGDVTKCKAMLESNAELVDSVEAGGFAALHFAGFQGNLQMIELLHGFKANFNVKNYDLNTPLMLAAKMKQNDGVRSLIEHGADPNFEGRDGITAAHHAAAMGHVPTVSLLASLGARLARGAADCGTVLHWGCHSGDIDVVGSLLYEHSLNVNAVDGHGGTPLFVACHLRKSEVIQFLLEHGADPNIPAKDGSTPLHFAAEHATLDDVKALLSFGANADIKDGEGHTPKDLAQSKNMAQSLREMSKPRADAAKRSEDAAHFKAKGNKVFMEGENVKASKFYTIAIVNDPTNHVFFSNRSACNFNMRQYTAALYDAKRCIALNPSWPKGYFRLGATLNAMKRYDVAKEAVAKGLELDASNNDLKTLQAELAKK